MARPTRLVEWPDGGYYDGLRWSLREALVRLAAFTVLTLFVIVVVFAAAWAGP